MAFYTFTTTTQPVQLVCHSGGSEKAEKPFAQGFHYWHQLKHWGNLGWVPMASCPSKSLGIGQEFKEGA